MTFKLKLATLLLFSTIIVSCEEDKPAVIPEPDKPVISVPTVSTPSFNEDSAYVFIKSQVDFGFRIPNTPDHDSCGVWLQEELRRHGMEVMVQEGRAKAWTNEILNIQNIIGRWNPDNPNRILLAAHWDTRPFADRDTINTTKPILGANDGASGVAVLLEVARNIQLKDPELGIDIIFFDTEDYGAVSSAAQPFADIASINDTWCLGSQYFAKNIPFENYQPQYGILLDMVGGKGAQFFKEGYSRQSASGKVNKIWQAADQIGYSNYFKKEIAPPIIDDHKYLIELANIPCLDIVDYKPSNAYGNFDFGKFHHRHSDNMDIIDKPTLKAVGQVVLHAIYQKL